MLVLGDAKGEIVEDALVASDDGNIFKRDQRFSDSRLCFATKNGLHPANVVKLGALRAFVVKLRPTGDRNSQLNHEDTKGTKLHNEFYRTRRRIPSFNMGTLKLISKPSRFPVRRR